MHTIDTDIQSSLHTRREYSSLGGYPARSIGATTRNLNANIGVVRCRCPRRSKARREPNEGYCRSCQVYRGLQYGALLRKLFATERASVHLFLS